MMKRVIEEEYLFLSIQAAIVACFTVEWIILLNCVAWREITRSLLPHLKLTM